MLGMVVVLQGLSMGFLDTGGNVLLLRIWGEHCGPWMQTLHFSFGLGAFVVRGGCWNCGFGSRAAV